MNRLSFICRFSLVRNYLTKKYTPAGTRIPTPVFGIDFPNPVGLAAGFDKNARYLPALRALGFGFVEIGTVTPLAQEGNMKPRLFRLPADKALVNRMGFNNDGARAVADRVRQYREGEGNSRMVIGGNIGKNKTTPNEMAWKDYETCFTELHGLVDYFVVNVSSPNTPGLRDLQQKDALQKILSHLQQINRSKDIQKPLLLKISPDLGQKDLDDVIDLAMEIRLDGLVAANTTISRDRLVTPEKIVSRLGAGGLSGKPLKEESRRITRYIRDRTNGMMPIMSSGGIFTARDAQEIMEDGASLVQVWTGFIYEGPGIVKKILNA